MSFAGMLALAVPFVAALSPRKESIVELDFPVLPAGQPVILNVEGYPLIILRPNKEQMASIQALDTYVTKKDYITFRTDIGAFVYWGLSTKRAGCSRLEVKPQQPSQLTEWDSSAQWLGGYWDPVCEVSFDYAGRAITSYKYSFNGFIGDYPHLNTPLVFMKKGNKLRVSRYGPSRFLTKP
jgi:hypothetical protein